MKVLVSGGTHGMGKGVAQVLSASQNNEVIILGRSMEHGEATLKELKKITGNNKISLVLCDLSRLSDVGKVIKEIHEKHKSLDGIFINAGLGYAKKRIETEDGMDPHFQVNYLSQFMLTLNLLDLLENSKNGGRVIFNVTQNGKINWDDIQMKEKWGFEKALHQAMVAKRMFLAHLHHLYRKNKDSKVSFVGFQIAQTVWTNQINIIPSGMKAMASMVKFFGGFISIEECGHIMSPLFTEDQTDSLKRSGKFITFKKNSFIELKESPEVLDQKLQDKLWSISLDLCKDKSTTQIAEGLKV